MNTVDFSSQDISISGTAGQKTKSGRLENVVPNVPNQPSKQAQ